MKKIFTCLLPIILLAFLSFPSLAQQGLLRYADRKAVEENYFEAGKGYAEAFAKKPSYRAAKGAAIANEKMRDYSRAYEWWKRVVAYGDAIQSDRLAYIAAANQAGKIEAVFDALDSIGTSKPEALRNLNLDSLRRWYEAAGGNTGVRRLEKINGASADFGWTKAANGRVYFSSDRGGSGDRKRSGLRIDNGYRYYSKSSDWTGRNFLSIYSVDEAGKVLRFEPPVPDVFHASDPFPLTDENLIFYTVTRDIRQSNDYEVHPEIFYSRLDASGNPVDFVGLPANAPLEYGLKSPFVDESQNRLYFSSNMPGGYGGYDLYVMEFDEGYKFGVPVNLGPLINTAGNEIDPFIRNGRFYFASDGHTGLGGLDIFVSDKRGNEFLGVKNMGLPYNSPQDDFGFFESADQAVVISSNRPGSTGLDDLFELETLGVDFRAQVVACDGTAVTGTLDVQMTEGSEKQTVAVQQGPAGELRATISADQEQEISIKKEGYFALEDKSLSSRGLSEGKLEKTYQLVKIPYRTAVYVDLVYYNLDQSEIREDAEAPLDKIAELLTSYSFLNIVVRSHTDARASNAYNEILSEKRADAVRDYLGKFGIARSRIQAEWLGETELTSNCGEGLPCSEENYQLDRRTELLLLAFPEVGKTYPVPPEMQGIDLCDVSNLPLPEELPTIYFGFDEAELSLQDKMALERVALMLRNMLNRRLAITGHTDNRGSAAYNEALSERRALVVKNYLEGKGIASDRLVYEFFGKRKPVNDCDNVPCTQEMHRLNRRTELSLPRSIPRLNKHWSQKE
jgi:outer membrane protein OmpA-like peptidoglycan-associated protein